ncbi:hypothetical protein D3248_10230 [Leucobacter zeae]|nr:hypothetical protein [Leucobacter zeae]
MTECTATEQRDAYLSRLDRALQAIPYGVASELRSAIAEELSGLDAADTAARIAELGSPESVAAAASAESGAGTDRAEHAPAGTAPATAAPAAPTPPAPRDPAPAARYLVDTRGFAITGAIALGVAGIALPGFGWAIGAGLVTSSRFWFRWEKAIAVLAPVAGVALALLAAWLLSLPGSGAQPEVGPNPLLPDGLTAVWVTSVCVGPLSGLWLLVRLRSRTAPVTLSRLDRVLGAHPER